MITLKELKAQKRKVAREILAETEKILHPNFKIGEIEIAHRHLTTGDVEFTAWKGDICISQGRSIHYDKLYISAGPSFYEDEMDNWNYLITGTA